MANQHRLGDSRHQHDTEQEVDFASSGQLRSKMADILTTSYSDVHLCCSTIPVRNNKLNLWMVSLPNSFYLLILALTVLIFGSKRLLSLVYSETL